MLTCLLTSILLSACRHGSSSDEDVLQYSLCTGVPAVQKVLVSKETHGTA
jgi:hypothetical protein